MVKSNFEWIFSCSHEKDDAMLFMHYSASSLFWALTNTYDAASCENSQRFLDVKYFRQKLHHRYLQGPKYVSVKSISSESNTISFVPFLFQIKIFRTFYIL